jgi:hypothetical protein
MTATTTTPTTRTVLVLDDYGETVAVRRIRLPAEPVCELRGEHRTGQTGITQLAWYVTPRSRRVVRRSYSIWQRGQTPYCVGETWTLLDAEKIARDAQRYGIEALAELVPVEDDLPEEYRDPLLDHDDDPTSVQFGPPS